MKRFRAIAIATIVAAMLAIVWFGRRPAEPSYNGHGLTYWLEPWQHHGMEPETNIATAFAEMDERAVEWMIGELAWRPSKMTALLNEGLRHASIRLSDRPDRRERVAMALARLGGRARAAIPALEQVATNSAGPRAVVARSASLAALARIRHEPVSLLTDQLTDMTPDSEWHSITMTLAYLGPHAEEAVPFLAKALNLTNTFARRFGAALALKHIARRPEECVPQLVAGLKSPEPQVKQTVLEALRAYGTNAASATDAVRALLNDPSISVARAASNTLRTIGAASDLSMKSGSTGLETPPPAH
jgi:hypothetical protein